MRILLLGNGGREHALAWKIGQSPLCSALFIAPGNAGTQSYGENLPLDILDNHAVAACVRNHQIDMVVVGPEAPLVNGVQDHLMRQPGLEGLIVVGPSAEGALLEGSKSFAKTFMQAQDIPTATCREFTTEEEEEGLAYLRNEASLPIVLKADGLAAGKGVVISTDRETAASELTEMLAGKFGEASRKVVVEQFLEGIEFSVFVLTDGRDYVILPVAKDYKPIGEGDMGANTGGMGAVSPPPFVDAHLMAKVEQRIIRPTIHGLQTHNILYEGFIFFGLMRVGDDPYVIEYNCRLGDPETEVVLPRLRNDLVQLFLDMSAHRLGSVTIEEDPNAAAAVILASGGYPDNYEKGKLINALDAVQGSIVFHAGTSSEPNGDVRTNGGRVLAVTSMAPSFREAVAISSKNAQLIQFEGKYFRRDIGFDL